MRHALPLVALCAALFTFSACDDGDCTDEDKDGYGVGGGCKAADCDDSNPLHHADCGACSDPDTDGRGVGCDLGPDCSPNNTFHWADCGKCMDSDLDGHGVGCDLGPDCDENDPDQGSSCTACVDADGDGFFTGCDQYVNRPGPDCDDTDPDNYLRCGFCLDSDGDGHYVGCDRYTNHTGPDCNDTDANNWAACGACVDNDGDSYYVGCDKYSGDIKGPDCNDASAYHHSDCTTCVDTDNDGRGTGCDLGADCSDSNRDVFTMCGTCADGDLDGYWAGCDTYFQHLGPDCNDANRDTFNTCPTCKDNDGDNYWAGCNSYINHLGPDCNDANNNEWTSFACSFCRDNDMDNYYVNCDAYTSVSGPDCSDSNKNVWASCGTCADTDGDFFYSGCDAYTTVSGPDCAPTDNRHWSDCSTCVDSDGDGRGASCDLGTDCNESSDKHWGDCATCVDNDGDGYGTSGPCDIGIGDCDDANAARHPGAADTTINGIDENCDGFDGLAFRDDFEDGVYTPEWTFETGDTYIATSSNGDPVRTGTRSLNLGGGIATVQSQIFDTTACASGVAFKYWVHRGYEPPDSGENLVLEWSTNGTTWNLADTTLGQSITDTSFLSHIGLITTAGVASSTFQIRFRTTSGSGIGFDDYFIDDLLVVCQQADSDSDGITDPIDCAPSNAKHWNDCGLCTDVDNDGFGVSGTCDMGLGDCNDGNATINPAAADPTVDGTDQNCNGFDGTTTTSPSTFPSSSISDSGLSASGCGAAGSISSSIFVSGSAGTLTDVDVSLNISHAADDQLDIWLQYTPATGSPVCVELSTDNGGATGNSYTSTVFSDQAATAITAGTAPFTGTFSPEGLLSTLNSKSKNGTWTLYVNDDTAGTAGTLLNWGLTLTYY